MRRITLFTVSALAAAALVWLLTRAGDLRDLVQGAGDRAALQDTASPGAVASGLRQGAGTVGPRMAPLAARKGARAAPQGRVGAPDSGAPDLSPGSELSGTGTAQAGSASSSGGASDVAVVAPQSGQPGAGAGNAPSNPGLPPDPLAFAGGAAPGAPGSPAPPAPEPVAGPGAPAPPTEAAPPVAEAVQAKGPLTPAQIAEKVNEALADVPPEQQDALEPVLTEEFTNNTNQAAGWVGASPQN